MTEALRDEYVTPEPAADYGLEVTASRPNLTIVAEPRPEFVLSGEDIAWWNALPSWRRELYLLPKFDTEAERIQAITQRLGMTVVSYAGGVVTRYTP